MLRMPNRDDACGLASLSTLARIASPFSSTRRLLELRRHRAARAAPRGPEVDDDRQLVARDEAFEARIVDRDRLAVEQGGAALAAHRLVARSAGVEPVARRCSGDR